MNWYYIDGPKRIGPLTETEWDALVRQGAIQPETRVWNEELPTWVPWKEVPKPADLKAESSSEVELPGEDDIFTRHARRRLGGSVDDQEEGLPIEEEQPLLHSLTPSAEVMAELERRALEPDYTIGFGSVLRRALAITKENLLQLAGATLFIYGLIYIGGSLPILNILMNFAFSGVLLGGLFSLFIRRMRGLPTEMGEVFSGFRPGYLRHLARKTLLSTLILTTFFFPGFVAMKIAGINIEAGSAEEIGAALGAFDLFSLLLIGFLFAAGGLVALYFSICWLFATPLIRDKGVPYKQAMRLSRLRVLQHPWRITLVLFFSACCFTAPSLFFSMLGLLLEGPVANLFSFLSYASFLFCLPAMTAVIIAMYEEAFGSLVVPEEGRAVASEEIGCE